MNLLTLQLLVCLGTAHVLGDFLLQSDRIARDKHKTSVLLQHALAVAALSYLLCGAWKGWLIPVAVFAAHGFIDAVKTRVLGKDLGAFLVDQAAHVASIVLIAHLAAREELHLSGVALFGAAYMKVLIAVAGVVVSLWAGGSLISLAMEPLLRELEQAASAEGGARSAGGRGLERGGRRIGQLERALIFLFVLTGQPGSIGFLIAAKSVFRFGELKKAHNRMEAEYILIGTMMSFGFGLLAAYATEALLALPWTP